MDQVFIRLQENTSPPYFLSHPPLPTNLDDSASSSTTSSGGGFDLNKKISPSILLIIIILAIIFFISGLLHLLVRFLLRPPNRDPDELENVTALQGQLQQLFHLHDSGVDQSFIDTLPVFDYKSIIGLKDPFDCAVCLCEFEAMDKLRLLPKCSHAFHMDCIDTWLLSHSTCPLCRASLLPDFPPPNSTLSPIVLVLESGGSESSREIVNDGEFNDIVRTNSSSVLTTNSHLGFHGDTELGSSRVEISQKSCEILAKDDIFPAFVAGSGEKVVAVKLGKFRNVDIGEGSSNNNSFDSRRCYSMGSFEYVMDENSSLKVPIRTPMKKQSSKKPSLPLKPGHRPAMSECDCESRRGFFPGIEFITSIDAKESNDIVQSSNANAIGRSKRESFSISKIWLRGKRGKQPTTEDSSRRAVSFRYPVNENSVPDHGDPKVNNGNVGERRSNSEMSIGRWRNGGSEVGCDEENQRYNSMDFQAKTPSFARRTLLWLVGKQNKVVNVHTSFAPNV